MEVHYTTARQSIRSAPPFNFNESLEQPVLMTLPYTHTQSPIIPVSSLCWWLECGQDHTLTATRPDKPKRTDVSLFQSRGVVDTISSHGHDLPLALATFHDDQFLLWRGTGEHNLRVVAENLIDLGRGHVTKVTAVDNSSLGLSEG